jgi:carbonic anhydrase
MKKVFHFDSQPDSYKADACVISCIDARFEQVTQKFLKKHQISWADVVKIAGGAKVFASPGQESDRAFALEQVRTSVRLHHTKRVLLMVHSDCGAYGGLRAFSGSEEREAEKYQTELRSAAEFLQQNVPMVDVECYYLRFSGVWTLDQG